MELFLAHENKLYSVLKAGFSNVLEGEALKGVWRQAPRPTVFCITPRSYQHFMFIAAIKQRKMLFSNY